MKLKSIYIENFCGISEFATSFNDKGVEISGANGTGKTSIFRAISWVLNGTDEFGNRIDPGNRAMVKLNIGGMELTELERKVTEAGTHCYMNGSALKVTDFNSSIREFIFNGQNPLIFLNPAYLPSLHWKEQRDIVAELAFPGVEEVDMEVSPDNRKKQVRNAIKSYEDGISKSHAVIGELNHLTAICNCHDTISARINDLGAHIKTLVNEKAECQKTLDETEQDELEQTRKIGEKLSDLFKNSPVYFTLFEQNKKGETKETCKLTYAGRTWSQLSAGEKIKAGLYLVQVFQQQFSVDAPVILDNFESITKAGELALPEVDCQQIRMKATESSELEVDSL